MLQDPGVFFFFFALSHDNGIGARAVPDWVEKPGEKKQSAAGSKTGETLTPAASRCNDQTSWFILS